MRVHGDRFMQLVPSMMWLAEQEHTSPLRGGAGSGGDNGDALSHSSIRAQGA